MKLVIPSQVRDELFDNLTRIEIATLMEFLYASDSIEWLFNPGLPDLVTKYERLGAKKGDAKIAAQLDEAGVRWLVSENRHFLTQIQGLPFTVITPGTAIAELKG